jgi:Ca2+-binding EF-hand superfamily protein
MFVSPGNISVLLFSVISFSTAGVLAADIPLRGPIPFESFDADGNKMISPQEFVETQNQRKKMRADANMPMGRMPGNQAFTDFDSNGDSLISPEELEAGRTAMRQQGGGPWQGMGPGMGRGMGPGMGPCPGMGPGMGRGMGPGPGMYRGRQMPDFTDIDLNGDGSVSSEEFAEARAQRMRQRSEQGYMMRNAASAPDFETIDTNADGKITPEEFSAHQAAMRQQGGGPWQDMGPGMRRGMGPGMGRGMGPGPGMYRGRQMPDFTDIDLNGDGSVSSEEFAEARTQRMRQRSEQGYMMRNAASAPDFETIDTNADGKITPEEFSAHQAAMRQQMSRRPPPYYY